MTDSYLNPPFLLGAMDSTGMGGLPTLGSSLPVFMPYMSTPSEPSIVEHLPHLSTNHELIRQISIEYADVLKRLADK